MNTRGSNIFASYIKSFIGMVLSNYNIIRRPKTASIYKLRITPKAYDSAKPYKKKQVKRTKLQIRQAYLLICISDIILVREIMHFYMEFLLRLWRHRLQ